MARGERVALVDGVYDALKERILDQATPPGKAAVHRDARRELG